jgi:hypothetical protein
VTLCLIDEHKFSFGPKVRLEEKGIDILLDLVKKISIPGEEKRIYETFKENFCRSSNTEYCSSSGTRWAYSDFMGDGKEAGEDAVGFLSAFCNACQELSNQNIHVPNHDNINEALQTVGSIFRIVQGRVCAEKDYVKPPKPSPTKKQIVENALADAMKLTDTFGASRAIDRVYLALQAYLREIAESASIDLPSDSKASLFYIRIRSTHPAFLKEGPKQHFVDAVAKSLSGAIDTFGSIRNNASMAHPNQLLDDPEGRLIINAMFSVFGYIKDVIQRYENNSTSTNTW